MKNNMKFSVTGGMGLPIPGSPTTTSATEGIYIPWNGTGLAINSNNNYPQILSKLGSNAPIHGSALNVKSKMILGQGLDFEKMPPSLSEFLKDVNNKHETINDIIYKMGQDLVYFGGYCLRIQWNLDKTIGGIKHIPFKHCRIGEFDEDGDAINYLVNNDWDDKLDRRFRRAYTLNTFNPDKIELSKFNDENEIETTKETQDNAFQILYYKTYSTSDDGFYPSPDYIQCLDACFTEVNIGISQNNLITNGLNGSYIISNNQDTIIDDKDKENVINELNDQVAGAANSGSILYIPGYITVDKLEALDSKHFESTSKNIRQRIITSHGIPPILLELQLNANGFSNRGEELEIALKQFQQTKIKFYQNQIIRTLNGLCSYKTTELFELSIITFELETQKELKEEDEVVVDSNIEQKK